MLRLLRLGLLQPRAGTALSRARGSVSPRWGCPGGHWWPGWGAGRDRPCAAVTCWFLVPRWGWHGRPAGAEPWRGHSVPSRGEKQEARERKLKAEDADPSAVMRQNPSAQGEDRLTMSYRFSLFCHPGLSAENSRTIKSILKPFFSSHSEVPLLVAITHLPFVF